MPQASAREETPSHRYYRACVGRWRSPVALTIEDPGALAASGMSWLDRVSLRTLAGWPGWLPPIWMHTSVAYDPSGEVVHRTVIRCLGVPLRRTVERFTLQPDGRRFVVSGDMSGEGEVEDDGAHARYALRWLGVDIRQETTREPDLVTVRQTGPGFSGTQRLVRQA